MSDPLIAAGVTFLLTLALVPPTSAVLRRRGALDIPSGRSSHDRPTVRGGGVAVAVVALVTIGLSSRTGTDRFPLVLVGGALALLGLADDLRTVSPVVRLLAQCVLALAGAAWLLGRMSLPWFALCGISALASLWIVAFVNAFNFMDGIDGISVAQAVVAGACCWAIGEARHVNVVAVGGAVLVGGALGFAPFNLPKARVFLGDAGSYFFGAVVAVLVIVGVRASIPLEAMAAPVSLYLADTATTLLRRARRHEKLLRAHRDHTYQRVVLLGWSHIRTSGFVLLLAGGAALLGSVSLSGSLELRAGADVTLVGLLCLYVALPTVLTRRRAIEARAVG